MKPCRLFVSGLFVVLLLLAACKAERTVPTPSPAPRPEPTAAVPADSSQSGDRADVAAVAPPEQGDEPGTYSSLAQPDCKVTRVDQETGGSESLCPGVAGYRLALLDEDARMSVDVIAPDGTRTPLDLWSTASGAFSSLGSRAEWRFGSGAGKVPTALIVRYEAFQYPEQPEKSRSYLLVAKLAGKESCLTARIEPGPEQNRLARAAADRAGSDACLQQD